jgi:hypothetical protein
LLPASQGMEDRLGDYGRYADHRRKPQDRDAREGYEWPRDSVQ